MKATWDAAQTRSPTQPFYPDKSGRVRPDWIDPSNEERLLEARIWSRWRFDGPPTADQPGLWAALVGIQVPLFNSRQRKGWGAIDLLGIDKYEAGAPVAVELKTGNSREVPLRAVLEVVSNAIALRKNWAAFGAELRARLAKGNKKYTPGEDKVSFPCVVLAPSAYWQRWAPDGELGKTVSAGSWGVLRELLTALNERRYPIRFACVSDLSAEACSFLFEGSVATGTSGVASVEASRTPVRRAD